MNDQNWRCREEIGLGRVSLRLSHPIFTVNVVEKGSTGEAEDSIIFPKSSVEQTKQVTENTPIKHNFHTILSYQFS